MSQVVKERFYAPVVAGHYMARQQPQPVRQKQQQQQQCSDPQMLLVLPLCASYLQNALLQVKVHQPAVLP
jgi:hypothetical protein